jgi:predicted PurR-regulated permease PerM
VTEKRLVRFRVRTILQLIGLVIAAWAVLSVLSITRQVISWFLVALFRSLALNPAVEWLLRHGVRKRGHAAGITYSSRSRQSWPSASRSSRRS